jgi:hypothetical protein
MIPACNLLYEYINFVSPICAGWAQVQTFYQQQTPHLQSNTQTHLDIGHSTLGYNIQFKH